MEAADDNRDPENMAIDDEYANDNGGPDEYGSNMDHPEEFRDDSLSPSNGIESSSAQANERRQSGRQVARRNYAADNTNIEYLSESEDGHGGQSMNLISTVPLSYAGSLIVKADEPLKKYFFERLLQVIYLLGGTEESMRGWAVHVLPNERGLLSGILDVVYVSNRGRRFRNRVDVACSLGLMQTAKNTKSMSREQMYLIAMEMREKHLISQLIGAADGNCDEVRYINDNAKVVFEDKEIGNLYDPPASATTASATTSQESESVRVDPPKQEDNIFFSFGNVTVLNWGSIIPDLAFHTSTQIYPIGFKCIRQEHDVSLDKIVECLCEIDSIDEENPTTKEKVTIPLFRLSVAWMLGNGERRIRVYEARSPQQAWQAAMLETEGVDPVAAAVKAEGASESPLVAVDEQQAFEVMDEEEITLRNRICDERRKYFRALRQEQKQGLQAAVVPRLALDNVESFADEGILRLIEGMQGALDCINYTFVDSREQEGGRRNIWRGYGTINEKLKTLYKVYKKSSTPYDLLMNVGNLYGGSNPAGGMKRKASTSLLATSSSEAALANSTDPNQANADMRKRMRQDIRDHRLHASSIHKTRNIYIKRLENTVSNLKNNFMKSMRKRREELKYIIGGISDQEYQVSRNIHIENMTSDGLVGRIMSTSHILNEDAESTATPAAAPAITSEVPGPSSHEETASSPLPEPSNGMILFDGHIFGNILEMWDYLQTFSDVFDLGRELGLQHELPEASESAVHPEFFQLCHALKHVDPHFQRLLKLSSSMKSSYDAVSQNYPTPTATKLEAFDMTTESAEKIINAIGISLTRTLLRDYEHIMGVEAAKESLGNYKIILNSLTWREIARVVLISGCGRDLGVTEMDMVSALKGRGYYCTPETADKKALRLCRRRILNQYYLRYEAQESIYGFQAGICVRVPTPSHYNSSASSAIESKMPLWSQLILEMQDLPENYGWLIYDMVYVAAMLCEDEDMKVSLRAALSSQIDASVANSIRTLLLTSLEQYYPNYAQSKHSQVHYAEEVAPYQWPTPAWEVMRQHFAYQYLYAKSDYLQILNSDANGMNGEEDMEEEENQLRASDDEDEDGGDDDAGTAAAGDELNAQRSSSAITIPESADENATMEEDEARLDNDTPVGQLSTTNVIHPSVDATVTRRTIPGRFVSKASASASSKLPSEIVSALEYDPQDYEKLSIAMKRCHTVLYELIRHHLAQPFVAPVDRKVVLGYYNFISQPISLQEIKRSLLKGVYEDHIYRVYADVMILFENSVAFNPDSSPIHQSALKLVIIFERLFYEIVLSWDQSLESNAYCHICRQQHHPSQLNQSQSTSYQGDNGDSNESIAYRITSCERCEACYHFGCLDPPVTTTLRTDWYCLGCIESRSIANVHPNKFTKVYHPEQRKLTGQVVGIEQVRQTLQFIIDFDDRQREVWDGKKVRQYAITPDDPECGVPLLPAGYTYDDYDLVCGIARGYAGWGSFHSLVPAFLSDSHSYYARRRTLIDPFFHKSRLAIAWLGSASLCPEDLGIHETVTIFRAIAQRAMSSSALIHALSKQDESNGDALALCGENIAKGNIGYDKLIRKLVIEMAVEDDPASSSSNTAAAMMNNDEVAVEDEEFDADDEEWIERVANMDPSSTATTTTTAKTKTELETKEEANASMEMDEDAEDLEAEEGGGPQTKSVSDIDLARWEHRRLSRRRGREDALASHALLNEIIRDVDIDGAQELEEIGPIIRQVAGDFYHSAMSAIVKVCTVKPHDDLDFEEWSRGYQSKTTQFQEIDYEHPILCGYCGQDEYSVGSIFVYGQTYDEFLNERDDLDQQRKKRIDLELGNPNPRAAKRRGRYARLHVARSMLWKPCYEADAAMEAQECELIHHEFMEGSLPVHECCAEMMTTYREELLQRSQRTDNHRVTDIIAGIGRGKTTAIGRDRDGNTYWVFCGLPGIFVCSESKGLDIPQAANSAAMDMMVATNPKLLHATSTTLLAAATSESSSTATMDQLRVREKNAWEYYHTDFRFYPDGESMLAAAAGGGTMPSTSVAATTGVAGKQTMWRLYRQDEDIRGLLQRLDKRHLQERTLAQAISLLFPTAMMNPPPAMLTRNVSSASACSVIDPITIEVASSTSAAAAAVEIVSEEELPSQVAGEAMDVEASGGSASSSSEAEAELDDDDDDDDAVIEFKTIEKRRGRPPKSLANASSAASANQPVTTSSDLLRSDAIFRFVNDEASAILSSSHPPVGQSYQLGDEVLIEGMSKYGLLWNAKIVDIRSSITSTTTTESSYYYKVSYNHWDDGYDGWIPEANIRLLVSSTASAAAAGSAMDSDGEEEAELSLTDPMIQRKNQQYLATSRQIYLQRQIAQGSPLLRSLRAYVYLRAPHRESSDRPLINFASKTSSTMDILRIALFMIERALPVGAIDDSEDRWGDDFAIAWREAVSQANDASSLMQVMIMLEYGIRTAWLIPAGLKLMSCLPSRIHCLRNATIGLIAMKIWSLDQSIRYDKINYPKGHTSAIHNTSTSSSKSKSSSSSSSSSSSMNIGGFSNDTSLNHQHIATNLGEFAIKKSSNAMKKR
jgi:hypothetical protein